MIRVKFMIEDHAIPVVELNLELPGIPQDGWLLTLEDPEELGLHTHHWVVSSGAVRVVSGARNVGGGGYAADAHPELYVYPYKAPVTIHQTLAGR